MIFSHMSDIHLGFTQYHSEEREEDVYMAFNQAIDTSIRDHVDFAILSGDIFHVPNPSGKAIVTLANALKRLRQNNIDSFFILGEHDISRIRATPVPFVYHNLDFSRYIGNGKTHIYKDVMIMGFDKRRQSEIDSFEQDFARADAAASNHRGHRILALHQGISEINKFAGEISSTDLPKNFTYYAMGHLHDQELKRYSQLGGPLAYPGSIEVTSSESIKETQKGFYEVDISGPEASPSWIRVDTRPQISVKTSVEQLPEEVDAIAEKIMGLERKPVVEIKVTGKAMDAAIMQGYMSKLAGLTLRCFWKHVLDDSQSGAVFMERPADMEGEMLRLAKAALGSDEIANFAVHELLPVLSRGAIDEACSIVNENYEQSKRRAESAAIR